MKPDYIWCQCFYTRVPICYKSLVLIVVPLAKNGSSPIIGAISFEAFEAIWSCRNWCWKTETDIVYTRRTVVLICDEERLRQATAADCIWWFTPRTLITIHDPRGTALLRPLSLNMKQRLLVSNWNHHEISARVLWGSVKEFDYISFILTALDICLSC